jgi:hypothetical protein
MKGLLKITQNAMESITAINKPMKTKADAKLADHRKPVHRFHGNTDSLCDSFSGFANFSFNFAWLSANSSYSV